MRNIRFIDHFVGEEEKHILYDSADIVVLASTRTRAFEAWGLVCNEALVYGKPMIVSSTVGAAGEVVRDGFNGTVFEDRDIEAFAGRIRELSTNTGLRQKFAAASLSLIPDYSPEAMIRGFDDLLSRYEQ